MERISATDPSAAARAAQILAAGGVILYPTDTLYGLGADALSDSAVDKIYAIKGREPGKPIHCIVADKATAAEYGEVNEAAERLMEKFLPGPLTVILKKKPEISGGIARGMETIGIRIPDDPFCRALANGFRRPFTTTSANLAGAGPEGSVDAILAQLGERGDAIDLVIDGGTINGRRPSTVVDVSSGSLTILREGAIPAQDIGF
jgi:L-threonylcarbamoyladenylate synthase